VLYGIYHRQSTLVLIHLIHRSKETLEIKGRLLVKNNAIYIHDGGHEIPLLTWIVSFGVRVNDKIKITMEKLGEK
jgi:hypothetical protein